MGFYANKTVDQAEMILNALLRDGGYVWIKDGTGNTTILTEGFRIGYASPVLNKENGTIVLDHLEQMPREVE